MLGNRSNQPTVVCAWCTRVLSEGSRDVSHGICEQCARDVMSVAERTWRGQAMRGTQGCIWPLPDLARYPDPDVRSHSRDAPPILPSISCPLQSFSAVVPVEMSLCYEFAIIASQLDGLALELGTPPARIVKET